MIGLRVEWTTFWALYALRWSFSSSRPSRNSSEQTDPLFPLAPCTLLRSFLVKFVERYPRLDVLLQWFPSLDGVLDLGMFDSEQSRQSEYTSLREANIRAQKTRSWKRLDKLICEATMFYVLGLRCPIRHLVIDYCGALFKEYVADTLPGNLPCTSRSGKGLMCSWASFSVGPRRHSSHLEYRVRR